MENALELRGVSRAFKGFALQDVTLDLPAGTILGLIGENGAGKSTTIRLIMNALARDSGEIHVLGVDNRSREFLSVKDDIGVVLDEAHFPELITVRQVNAIMKDTYRRWDEALYFQYIQRFELPEKKPFKDFSRGMTMKLAIAVALSHHPRFLILDEATSGLDPIVRDEILDLFAEFTREEDHSILISSHIISDLEKICDYIAFLHQGKLLFCEEKDRLLETYGIVQGELELPEEAVAGHQRGKYGTKTLVRRDLVPSAIPVEKAGIEEIILFLVKGEQIQ
ncbi:ABC transporter ATP-binding protein [Oscillibacter sp. MSJ-2]|uniref:ABC transporter ATP-binding protein n=1 Tax=Dysosmobacter acutus TaxID=2841504 RepID=A0ABS6F977_9FIRM|nr:ABC transporter ATP-binding protein [Dysosmobacter acutus]MBU5625915.1 ABC transporter ATP-binding protein [Dysosmobacter acutus]